MMKKGHDKHGLFDKDDRHRTAIVTFYDKRIVNLRFYKGEGDDRVNLATVQVPAGNPKVAFDKKMEAMEKYGDSVRMEVDIVIVHRKNGVPVKEVDEFAKNYIKDKPWMAYRYYHFPLAKFDM